MKFRSNRKEEPLIEMTPLIDVVFQLLLFFMLTTTLRNSPSFDVELPEASTDKLLQEDHSFTIAILANGDIIVEDSIFTEEELLKILKKKVTENSQLSVLIEADRSVEHQHVVRLMDLASEAGVEQLQIGTAQTK